MTNNRSQYYDTEYSGEFPAANFYLDRFDYIPRILNLMESYDLKVISDMIEHGYECIWDKQRSIDGVTMFNAKAFIKNDALVVIYFKSSKQSEYEDENPYEEVKEKIPDNCSINLYYRDKESFDSLIIIATKHIKEKVRGGRISLVVSRSSGLSTVDYEVTPIQMDIDKHYGKAFRPVHDKIINTLSEPKGKGLVLLHGEPGTGKTSYIRYLATQLGKSIIFIPPYLTENISGPDFIPFLLKNSNSILIIEDAEKVILDRDGSDSNRQGVSNLLNLTDGILSDCLNIQVIATFNTSRERIDKALLRKGRLIGEWKFDKLSVEDSNEMLAHLGKEHKTEIPLTLTDIYNIDELEYASSKTKQKQTIGFNNR